MPYIKNIVIYLNMDNPRDHNLLSSLNELSKITSTPVSTIVKNILNDYLKDHYVNQKTNTKPKSINQTSQPERPDISVNHHSDLPQQLQEQINQNGNQQEDDPNNTILGIGLKE
jgi:hypothetical protein